MHFIHSTYCCLKLKTADSIGISESSHEERLLRVKRSENDHIFELSLRPCSVTIFATEEPLGKRAVWSVKQHCVFYIAALLLNERNSFFQNCARLKNIFYSRKVCTKPEKENHHNYIKESEYGSYTRNQFPFVLRCKC